MRIAILQLIDSAGVQDLQLAVERAGMQAIPVFCDSTGEIGPSFDGLIVMANACHELVLAEVKKHSAQGKAVLGIGQGAKILIESGMVPGLEDDKVGITLTKKPFVAAENSQAACTMHLSEDYQRNAFTRCLTTQDVLSIPVDADVRFVMGAGLREEIRIQGMDVFHYGNGDIAAIANKSGNVMAILPSIERTQQGDVIFHSMREYLKEGYCPQVTPLYYYPRISRRDKNQS